MFRVTATSLSANLGPVPTPVFHAIVHVQVIIIGRNCSIFIINSDPGTSSHTQAGIFDRPTPRNEYSIANDLQSLVLRSQVPWGGGQVEKGGEACFSLSKVPPHTLSVFCTQTPPLPPHGAVSKRLKLNFPNFKCFPSPASSGRSLALQKIPMQLQKKTGKCGNFEEKKQGGIYPNPTSILYCF